MNYEVVKANNAQMEFIFNKHWNNPEVRQKVREMIKFMFVAFDENENIIGYLSIDEKPVPPPINGTAWWICNINTYTAYRRNGIASAMVKEMIKHAEQTGIHHLEAVAQSTVEASMFWLKQNFSFRKCGKPSDDGNYQHIIFHRINKTEKTTPKHNIVKADKSQVNLIIDEHLADVEFYKNKRDEMFALIAVDKDEQIIGFIAAYKDELGVPLTGTVWEVPYVYVRPELRRQRIGSALINEMAAVAESEKVKQLLFILISEDDSEFWENNNLDMFFWKHLSPQNTIITAGLKI